MLALAADRGAVHQTINVKHVAAAFCRFAFCCSYPDPTTWPAAHCV